MSWPGALPDIAEETHYDGRPMRCFAERPAHVDAMFRQTVARWGDAEAVVAGATRLTYAALDQRVDRVAANLASLGVAKGERVALALGNRPEFLALVLACYRLGAIAVPLNVRMRRPEYEYVLGHSGARLLVHEAAVAEHIPEGLSALAHRFACGGEAPGARPFAELLAAAAPPPAPEIAEEDVATILYTSGTTGRPKGATLTHLGLVHSCLHFEVCMELGAGERCVLAVPASHVTGLVAVLLSMLRVGGCAILMEEFKARAYLELASAERCTVTVLVPAMYSLCLLDPEFDRFDLSSWRVGGFGGAPMPEATIAELAERLPELVLCNAYGATETTSPTTFMPLGRMAGRTDSVGRVVPCGDVRVVDDGGRDVEPGEAGEIWIAGAMVVPGYWNDADADRDNFRDGFWMSGDIGSMDEEGYVRVFDRKKDMINRAGYKVYSAEVENVLSHHPGLLEVAIVGRPDPVLGERVHAYVVAARAAGVSGDDLRAFCAERMSDYKVPESFTFLDAPLPRNPNGKVVKAVLRDMLAEEEGAA